MKRIDSEFLFFFKPRWGDWERREGGPLCSTFPLSDEYKTKKKWLFPSKEAEGKNGTRAGEAQVLVRTENIEW